MTVNLLQPTGITGMGAWGRTGERPKFRLQSWPKLCGTSLKNALHTRSSVCLCKKCVSVNNSYLPPSPPFNVVVWKTFWEQSFNIARWGRGEGANIAGIRQKMQLVPHILARIVAEHTSFNTCNIRIEMLPKPIHDMKISGATKVNLHLSTKLCFFFHFQLLWKVRVAVLGCHEGHQARCDRRTHRRWRNNVSSR